jgi:hypothetical protein
MIVDGDFLGICQRQRLRILRGAWNREQREDETGSEQLKMTREH